MPLGAYTRAAKVAKAMELEEHWVMVRRARDYARGHSLGGKATVSTMLFPGVSYMMVENAKADKIKAVLGERWATDVLTKEEQLKLVDWIVGCARGKAPATDEEISEKVVQLLKARKADNRRRKGGPGTIKLTLAENRLATERGAEVSHTRHSTAATRSACAARRRAPWRRSSCAPYAVTSRRQSAARLLAWRLCSRCC